MATIRFKGTQPMIPEFFQFLEIIAKERQLEITVDDDKHSRKQTSFLFGTSNILLFGII